MLTSHMALGQMEGLLRLAELRPASASVDRVPTYTRMLAGPDSRFRKTAMLTLAAISRTPEGRMKAEALETIIGALRDCPMVNDSDFPACLLEVVSHRLELAVMRREALIPPVTRLVDDVERFSPTRYRLPLFFEAQSFLCHCLACLSFLAAQPNCPPENRTRVENLLLDGLQHDSQQVRDKVEACLRVWRGDLTPGGGGARPGV